MMTTLLVVRGSLVFRPINPSTIIFNITFSVGSGNNESNLSGGWLGLATIHFLDRTMNQAYAMATMYISDYIAMVILHALPCIVRSWKVM